MGKSSSTVITTNEQDQINGLSAVKGDNNTTQVLDAGAIANSYTYAAKVNDSTSNNIGALLGTINSIAGQSISAAADNSKSTIAALQQNSQSAVSGIQGAFTKANSGGLDPEVVLLGVGVLVVLAFVLRG